MEWYYHLVWVIPATMLAIIIMAIWKKRPKKPAPPPPSGGHGGHGHGHGHEKPNKLLTAILWVIGLLVAFIPIGLVITGGTLLNNYITAPTVVVVQPKKWCYTPCRMRTTWSERIRSEQPIKVKYEGKDWLQISGVGNDEIPYDKFNPGLAEFTSADPTNPKVAVYIYPPL